MRTLVLSFLVTVLLFTNAAAQKSETIAMPKGHILYAQLHLKEGTIVKYGGLSSDKKKFDVVTRYYSPDLHIQWEVKENIPYVKSKAGAPSDPRYLSTESGDPENNGLVPLKISSDKKNVFGVFSLAGLSITKIDMASGKHETKMIDQNFSVTKYRWCRIVADGNSILITALKADSKTGDKVTCYKVSQSDLSSKVTNFSLPKVQGNSYRIWNFAGCDENQLVLSDSYMLRGKGNKSFNDVLMVDHQTGKLNKRGMVPLGKCLAVDVNPYSCEYNLFGKKLLYMQSLFDNEKASMYAVFNKDFEKLFYHTSETGFKHGLMGSSTGMGSWEITESGNLARYYSIGNTVYRHELAANGELKEGKQTKIAPCKRKGFKYLYLCDVKSEVAEKKGSSKTIAFLAGEQKKNEAIKIYYHHTPTHDVIVRTSYIYMKAPKAPIITLHSFKR